LEKRRIKHQGISRNSNRDGWRFRLCIRINGRRFDLVRTINDSEFESSVSSLAATVELKTEMNLALRQTVLTGAEAVRKVVREVECNVMQRRGANIPGKGEFKARLQDYFSGGRRKKARFRAGVKGRMLYLSEASCQKCFCRIRYQKSGHCVVCLSRRRRRDKRPSPLPRLKTDLLTPKDLLVIESLVNQDFLLWGWVWDVNGLISSPWNTARGRGVAVCLAVFFDLLEKKSPLTYNGWIKMWLSQTFYITGGSASNYLKLYKSVPGSTKKNLVAELPKLTQPFENILDVVEKSIKCSWML